jgi:hypothetical protein
MVPANGKIKSYSEFLQIVKTGSSIHGSRFLEETLKEPVKDEPKHVSKIDTLHCGIAEVNISQDRQVTTIYGLPDIIALFDSEVLNVPLILLLMFTCGVTSDKFDT